MVMSPTGRTRVLKDKQSHGGCFTCKARRVKCDEARPTCQRCVKANRLCQGYRHPSPSSTDAVSVKSLSPCSSVTMESDLSGELTDKLEALRLSDLGCKVLHQNNVRQSGLASSFWSFTLPQLGQSSPIVHCATAALGAAIEMHYLRPETTSLTLMKHYGLAVKQIQDAICTEDPSSVQIIAACMMLAMVDVLLARELHALTHLKGTLALLQNRQSRKIESSSETQMISHESSSFCISDEVEAAGAILDISTASYSLGLKCSLPGIQTNSSSLASTATTGLASLELKVIKTLHKTYDGAFQATRWKYAPKRLHPSGMSEVQQGNVVQLQRLVEEIGERLPRLRSRQRARALILRAQCNSALVYASMVLQPYECSYDSFVDRFESITNDAEAVVAHRALDVTCDLAIDFLPDLGVIQPLNITASKCRHPFIRRRALDILARTGREGPFHGKPLAAAGRRALQIEELQTPEAFKSFVNNTPLGDFIPESERCHGWGLDLASTAALKVDEIMGFYCQCVDVNLMMKGTTAEAHKADHFWNEWRERISLNTSPTSSTMSPEPLSHGPLRPPQIPVRIPPILPPTRHGARVLEILPAERKAGSWSVDTETP